jgi:FkbM family methyltransferase
MNSKDANVPLPSLLLSERFLLPEADSLTDAGDALDQSPAEVRGFLSEYGWVFLANDSNRFMDQLLGSLQWNNIEKDRAIGVLQERRNRLRALGCHYLKFIIPEKSVVYREYLPRRMRDLVPSSTRPALLMAQSLPGTVFYLDQYLQDAKSYGHLYFRGDTHVNWLGAYFVYQDAIRSLLPLLKGRLPPPIPLTCLASSLVGYDGDVRTKLHAAEEKQLLKHWPDVQFSDTFEHCVRYTLPAGRQRAQPCPGSKVLNAMQFDRPVLVTEVDDPSLPRAVIFHDSTAQFITDLLAEHFSRAVFVWHRGEVIEPIIVSERPDVVLQFMAERFVGSYSDIMVPLSAGPEMPPPATPPETNAENSVCGIEYSTRYGPMYCFADDLISRFLSLYGEWSHFETLLLSSLKPRRVFDIGAYIGTFSLAMSSYQPEFVLAVDANDIAYGKLLANLKRNMKVAYATANIAVTRQTGVLTGFAQQANNHGSFAIGIRQNNTDVPASIEASTLAKLRDEFGPYDLLKLDIEGGERDAIASDLDWITLHKPAIWAECNESADSLIVLSLLLECGYEVFFYRYPAFNPNNFNNHAEQVFPLAFEAGLLAVAPETSVVCPAAAAAAGASVTRMRDTEQLRRALWLTPRGGRITWDKLGSIEQAAHMARQTQGLLYKDFLSNKSSVPHRRASSGSAEAQGVFDKQGVFDHSDPNFWQRLGCLSGACSLQIVAQDAIECVECARQFRLDDAVFLDSHNVLQQNTLERIDYDGLHGVSLDASRHFGEAWTRLVRQRIPLSESLDVLELGAGSGLLSMGLAMQGDFNTLYVTEPSLDFLKANRDGLRSQLAAGSSELPDKALERIWLFNSGVDDLPFRAGSVNVVVANSVLHHVYDYEAALRRLYALLRPGGIVIFSEPVIEGKAFVGFMSSLILALDEKAAEPVFNTEEQTALANLATMCTLGFWRIVAQQVKDTADDKHLFSVESFRAMGLNMGWSKVEALPYGAIHDGLLDTMQTSFQMMGVRVDRLEHFTHLFEAFQKQVIDEVPEQILTHHAFLILHK